MANRDGDSPVPDGPSGDDVSLDHIPLHSTNLLTVLDENGVIKYESPAIERIFGFRQNALVGEQVGQYIHPDDREEVLETFRTVVSSNGETVAGVEYRHLLADETYRWVESVSSADTTPEGHYVVNTRDISDQKTRERELERTNERLDEFSRILSHDLRNPLQVARGRLELVREDRDDPHLGAIDSAHDRIETLIDDLQTAAHSGEGVDEPATVELCSAVEDCWRNVETRDATIACDTERVIRADESRLKQLLENLVRNAVEHGGEAVTVVVGELDDGFYVEDDGPGIPESDRQNAFDLDYSTSAEGTGLGLRIVDQVVEAHGWNVRIEEGSDGGTRFAITGVEFEA